MGVNMLDKLKKKRCKNCVYYDDFYCWCTYDKRFEGNYEVKTIKRPKLICFDKKG